MMLILNLSKLITNNKLFYYLALKGLCAMHYVILHKISFHQKLDFESVKFRNYIHDCCHF